MKETAMSTEPVPARNLEDDKRLAHVLYILHALAPFTAWILAIIAIVLGMAKRDDVRGTFLDSHFSWLSRTFWWGLLWIVVCGVITALMFLTVLLIPLAWLPYMGLFIWYLYRVIKGWLRLNDGRTVE
jgi:uncharacterized membrane protein